MHADEACLGNGREPPTPGGCGGLIERPGRLRPGARRPAEPAQAELWAPRPAPADPSAVERFDYFQSAADTTNNRMALRSAIVALDLLAARDGPHEVTFVSDSNYLVLGMREWVPAWRARGWRRKGGPIENLDLWQQLVDAAAAHVVRWSWVRGHAGHPKNEYANALATRAAAGLLDSGGLVPSGFLPWLDRERTRGLGRDYDPDEDLRATAG